MYHILTQRAGYDCLLAINRWRSRVHSGYGKYVRNPREQTTGIWVRVYSYIQLYNTSVVTSINSVARATWVDSRGSPGHRICDECASAGRSCNSPNILFQALRLSKTIIRGLPHVPSPPHSPPVQKPSKPRSVSRSMPSVTRLSYRAKSERAAGLEPMSWSASAWRKVV